MANRQKLSHSARCLLRVPELALFLLKTLSLSECMLKNMF